MASIRTALTQTFATTYLQLALQVVGLVVLARLLGPEEIGVYTIAAVFAAFAQVLRNFAVGHYIIQEPELTPDRVRAAFTVTLLLAFSMALMLYLAAPYAGDFYKEPGVEAVLSLLAVNFLLTPFGTIVLAHFRRDLQFGKIMLVETASAVVHTGTGIALAFAGLSYMSLAWAAIAGTITSLILAQTMRPAGIPWMPGVKEIKRVFSFGLYMTGSSILTRLGNDLPSLIIGKTLGFSAVGLLSRGNSLIDIFHRLVIQGIRPVIMPFFSAKQRSGEDLGSPYLYAVTCVTGLAWPFFISLALLAEPVVIIILGSKWTDVTPLLSLWALAPSVLALTPFDQDTFVAAGAVKQFFRLQTYAIFAHILVVVGGAFHSLEALIVAFIISQTIRVFIMAPALYSLIGIDVKAHWQAASSSLLVAFVTGMAVFLSTLLPSFSPVPVLAELGAGGLAALLGWLLACRITGHPLMGELTRAFSAIQRRRSAH